MSCDEWLRGEYWIRNKTEYNKVIRAIVRQYNEDIAELNRAIKKYKRSTKNRNKIDWSKFRSINSNLETDWRLEHIIECDWKRGSGIPKVTFKEIMSDKSLLSIVGLKLDSDKQLVQIHVQKGNWAVERWPQLPGISGLYSALDQVKWSQRGEKDGGYLAYWSEYHECEGNGGPTYQNYLGRLGEDVFRWTQSRPF